MSIDNDIQLEGMCPKCLAEMENKKCNTCGDKMFDRTDNPNFDEEWFEKLKQQAQK